MNQLAKTEDFTTKATEQEMFECLTLLSSLPSRASANEQVNIAGYYLALEGVSRHGLQTATKLILQGSLGHTFLPSPPELRQECNKVMKPIFEARAWDADRDRALREQREEQRQRAQSQSSWTPESRARATAKWEAEKARQRLNNAAEEKRRDHYDTSPEAAMTRLQALAEANGKDFNLDRVPNAPHPSTFQRLGRAA